MHNVSECAMAAQGDLVSPAKTAAQSHAIPPVVYCLSLAFFALTTSELMISGLMPSLQQAFARSMSDIGNLISLYALGMMFGGPIVTIAFLALKIDNKRGLLMLLVFYAIAQAIAASTSSFQVMMVARVVTGMAAATSLGLTLALTAQMVSPDVRGKASSMVFAGLMLCTVFGVPAATLIDQHFGWRASFWSIVVLVLFCALVVAVKIAKVSEDEKTDLASELREMRKPKLWATYSTSALVIGASFAAYAYFMPILTGVSGFSAGSIPLLLAIYGAANIIGNYVAGRFADRHTLATLFVGIGLMIVTLTIFALFAEWKPAALIGVIGIGLTGIALNPALTARVMRTAYPGALVNAMHASVINIGLSIGPWVGGMALDHGFDLHAPLFVALVMTCLALLTLVPRALRKM